MTPHKFYIIVKVIPTRLLWKLWIFLLQNIPKFNIYFIYSRVYSVFTHVASIYNKRNRLHKKRVQLPGDWFGTPLWPPWRHVKTLYMISVNYLRLFHSISIHARHCFVLLSGNLLKSPSPSHKLCSVIWKWPHKTIQDFENDTAAKWPVPSHM